MGCNQLYSLSWGEFSSSLSSTVQFLRCHGDLVDVTLAAGGKIFPAHKLVLSAASPLLMELLKSTQCQHPVVMLAGIAASDLEALLQFVYQGEVSVDPSQLPSLLQAAQCLDIQALSPATMPPDKTVVGTQGDGRIGIPVIRKRKRKAKLSCLEDPNAPPPVVIDSKDPQDMKENESVSNADIKKPPLISDLPVSCGLCGAMLRQSRNLRRHMELIHMKPEDPPRKRRTKKCPELPGEGIPGVSVGESPGVSDSLHQSQSGNSQPDMPGHDRSQRDQQQQQQQEQEQVMGQQIIGHEEQMNVYQSGGGPPGGPAFMYQEPAYPPYPPAPQPHPRPPDIN